MISTDPKEVAAAAACYCYRKPTYEQVRIYLLAVLAGLDSESPADLAEASACYCYDAQTMRRVEAYLLNVIANGGSAPPGDCVNLEGAGDPT